MPTSSLSPDSGDSSYEVDSTTYPLPDGRSVIGLDAYRAEMVKAAFAQAVDR